MRFFLDLEEHNGSYELDSWQPETTIADLLSACRRAAVLR